MKKYLPLLSMLFCVSCVPFASSNSLTIDKTIESNNFSITLKSFTYSTATQSDENRQSFTIEYNLVSKNEKIIEASNFGYSLKIDNKSNFTNTIIAQGTPKSIAPNETVTIFLSISCFKDWEKADIEYKSGGYSYSFVLEHANFPKSIDTLPYIKPNEPVNSNNNEMTVSLDKIHIVTPSYSADFTLYKLFFTLKNNLNEDIKFSGFDFIFDGVETYLAPDYTTTTSFSMKANSSADCSPVVRVNGQDWKEATIRCKIYEKFIFKFHILRSDYQIIK